MKTSPMNPSWTLFEPTTQENEPRTAIYLNNNLLMAAQVTPLHVPLRDVTAIELTTADPRPMLIINVYKPCDRNIIPELHEHLRKLLAKQNYSNIIIAGDFNLHHPMWNPAAYTRHDEEADTLVEMMADLELNLLIPAGTATYPNPDAKTAIDLVWGNTEVTNRIIKCRIAALNDHCSDHFPIETIISVQTDAPQTLPAYNYAKTNWKELNAKLESYLPEVQSASDKITTKIQIDTYAIQLVEAITKAVQETTPRKRPSPHSKRWWTEHLTNWRKKANKLRNIYLRTKIVADRVAWRAMANKYKKEIKQAKADKWKEYVNDANDKSIYKIKNYILNTFTPAFVPTLDDNAATNEQKIIKLQKAFFPKPPKADLSDIACAVYPEEVSFNPQISIRQIREAVNKLASDKAPGPDEISNRILKNTLPIIERHLQTLMQASINLGHFPKPFKHTTTVVIRKPNKPDYTKVKAYRPIALENTLGKVMESIVAEIISYLTEMHELLPAEHFGGRPGRSSEDAMMILSENIHHAWREKKVYTAVFMDVAGAFNNVHHKRLIHNMSKRRIPESISRWISSFLQGRSTQLQFNGIKTERISTPAGVPQGSPLSPLLYMYYNADLLEIAPERQGTRLGFIDDIAYGVQGKSGKANVRTLQIMLKEAEEWRRKHGAQFERSKYILVHFTRNPNLESNTPLTINGLTITPSNEAKYLGVTFDKELRFRAHLQYVAKKGTNAAMALSSIAKCNWGAPFKYVRQLFLTVVAPRMDYAAAIWHRPTHDGSMEASMQTRKLSTIQRLAMKATLGCFKTTPTAAMEVESGIQPPWIRLQTKVLLAISRMQSLSRKHPIKEWLDRALRTRTAVFPHRSNLENALQQFPYMCETIESIEPFLRPPWWEPKTILKIENTKENAKAAHDKDQECPNASVRTIYTDGSGIENKIGAAAYVLTTKETRHHHLGSQVQFNVYAAELSAIYIALKSLWNHQIHSTCRIYSDSQAALKAIDRPHRQSGQEIIRDTLDHIDEITNDHKHLQVEMVWIPGHSDIEGNEQADAEAKKAAINPILRQSHKHRPLKSGRARYIKTAAKEQWQRQWRDAKTARSLRHIMKTKKKGIQIGPSLYNEISDRYTATTIAQLRTGHCGLNLFLHRFGLAKSPYCKCGYGKENAEHYLLECKNYRVQRKKLRQDVGTGNMKMGILLGDPSMIQYTVAYVKATGRFDK